MFKKCPAAGTYDSLAKRHKLFKSPDVLAQPPTIPLLNWIDRCALNRGPQGCIVFIIPHKTFLNELGSSPRWLK